RHRQEQGHHPGPAPPPHKGEEEAGRVPPPRRFHFTETCSRPVSHSTSQLERPMSIPKPLYNPPFNVTRASHSVLSVKDLAVSRNFYVDLLGFIVSDEDRDALYLRGVAEACHHSLVLKRARGEPQAERVGMRVFS